jgi:integrase
VSAQKKHETTWKRLQPLASTKACQLNTAQFQRIANQMRAEGLKRASLEKYRNLCSLLCKEAMRHGAMSTNYGALVQLPESDAEERLPFTDAQVKKIWDVWQEEKNPTAGTVILLCYTGMRPNELKYIEKHDGYIVSGSKTEKGRDRIIPYPEFVQPILDSVNYTKLQLNNWRNRQFNPLMERLGIEGRVPYSCRHTYANMQKRRNVDPEIMMDIMGHEDYATAVENYHHITEDDIDRLKSAVAGLNPPV